MTFYFLLFAVANILPIRPLSPLDVPTTSLSLLELIVETFRVMGILSWSHPNILKSTITLIKI